MALSVDYGGDYAFVDGTETVTLTPKPTGTAVTTVKASRSSLGRAELTAGGVIGASPGDVIFYLWDDTLGGTIPKTGDFITDADGTSYVIRTVTLRSDEVQWRCLSVQAAT